MGGSEDGASRAPAGRVEAPPHRRAEHRPIDGDGGEARRRHAPDQEIEASAHLVDEGVVLSGPCPGHRQRHEDLVMWSLGDEPEEFLIRVDRWALKVIWQGRSRRWSGKARPAERDDPVSFM